MIMNFLTYVIPITSALLAVDTLFSLYNFRYSYFLELKYRYSAMGKIPSQYKVKLRKEIDEEVGGLRMFVHLFYIPWLIFCFLSPLWYLPIILSIVIVVPNLIYNKPYISPYALFLKLALLLLIYLYAISIFITKFG
jgi:hypothetical protein